MPAKKKVAGPQVKVNPTLPAVPPAGTTPQPTDNQYGMEALRQQTTPKN